MSGASNSLNISLRETATLHLVLHLAQGRYQVRLLSVDELVTASKEADAVMNGLGLTAVERLGVRIEVSSSDDSRGSGVGAPTATFAQLEFTRSGWRLNRVGRRTNRPARTRWLATTIPSEDVLARAAERTLRRGTNGFARL